MFLPLLVANTTRTAVMLQSLLLLAVLTVVISVVGNALLLVVLTLLHDYCNKDTDHCPGFLRPLATPNYLQVVIILEVLAVTPGLVIYLGR